MALISLDHISKIYPKGTRPALSDVNVHIDRGDFVFLVGASGSGKTTLLSLLLHEEEASDGEIRVAGNDLRRLSSRQVPQYRRSIGFIFQDFKLLNNKTVWQNVAFALEVIGANKFTVRSLVPKVLETVGLTGKEKNYPHELSGGEAQRVAIARAYVNHPQILLADEPTGNLDPTTSLGIMEVLDAINRTGTTIVMATHNEEIVNSMRKRVVELHNGKIVRDQAHGSYDSALYFPDVEVESKAHQVIGSPQSALSASGAEESQTTLGGTASHTEGIPIIGSDQAHEGTYDINDARMASQTYTVDAHPAVGGEDGVPAGAKHALANTASQTSGEDRDVSTLQAMDALVQEMHNDAHGDEGIARLAQSMHSGRTGRYGEVFQSVETTMTWGKGLPLVGNGEEGNGEENDVQTANTDNGTDIGDVQQQTTQEEAEAVATNDDNRRFMAPPSPPMPPSPPASDTREPLNEAQGTSPAGETDEQHAQQSLEQVATDGRADDPEADVEMSEERHSEDNSERGDEQLYGMNAETPDTAANHMNDNDTADDGMTDDNAVDNDVTDNNTPNTSKDMNGNEGAQA